jgi:hypothetical protein
VLKVTTSEYNIKKLSTSKSETEYIKIENKATTEYLILEYSHIKPTGRKCKVNTTGNKR